MATKRDMENEIEKQLIYDSDSDCYTEGEAGSVHDMGCEDEEDKEVA
jgi:hypothetical protein